MDELRTALRNMIEWAEALLALYRFELENNTKPEEEGAMQIVIEDLADDVADARALLDAVA